MIFPRRTVFRALFVGVGAGLAARAFPKSSAPCADTPTGGLKPSSDFPMTSRNFLAGERTDISIPLPPRPDAGFSAWLSYSVILIDANRHAEARDALALALKDDRNDPTGQIALGVLYLHTGSAARAAEAFGRALDLSPRDPLARAGIALAAAQLGRPADAIETLQSLDPKAVPFAADAARALRVSSGDAARVASELSDVTPENPDLLRVAVAGFAALSIRQFDRGEALLDALRKQPSMIPLFEPSALTVACLPGQAFLSGATPLRSAIGFPPSTGLPLSGRTTLSFETLPPGTAMVEYLVDGSGYRAVTNVSPFAVEWNTARLPNGLYTLRMLAYDSRQSLLAERGRTVRLSNPAAPSADRLAPTERAAMRAKLTRLMAPRPSRKAVHHALAVRAVARVDNPQALARIESTVAIDPSYQQAFATLQQYNRRYVGGGTPYWAGKTTQKLVALTFDDGPNPLKTPLLLDILKAENVPATFFVVGMRAEAAPDLLNRMIADGHEIANHSWSHPNLTFLPPDDVRRELGRTSTLVRDVTGRRPKFYRPPGGNFNGATAEAAAALGMDGAYWSVDGFKFEGKPFTPDDLTKFVLSRVRPGAIVLLHNAPDNTINAVPAIVRGLRAKGYTIVTMAELARRCQKLAPNQKAAR